MHKCPCSEVPRLLDSHQGIFIGQVALLDMDRQGCSIVPFADATIFLMDRSSMAIRPKRLNSSIVMRWHSLRCGCALYPEG